MLANYENSEEMTLFHSSQNSVGVVTCGLRNGILALVFAATAAAQAQSIFDVPILSQQDSAAGSASASTGNRTASPSKGTAGSEFTWGQAGPASASHAQGGQRQAATLSAGGTAGNQALPQTPDHLRNQSSDVFGAQLFTGAFAQGGSTQFNPDYAVAIGDQLQVRMWGAFSYEATLSVDPKGNVFLPHAGPVRVQGVRNEDLQKVVQLAVSKTFRNNVHSYTSLAAAQPVRVFVGGNVNRPGLYNGTSMDSVLHYLDMAGGVDAERGSYLHIEVKRGAVSKARVNLYDFLLNGTMPLVQLADGDVIFVPPYAQRVQVIGMANNAKRFEFDQGTQTVAQLMQLAKPQAQATHVRVQRNTGSVKNTEYYPLEDAQAVQLQNGDEVEFTADKKPGTISVRVEGEHSNAQEYVLPYGTRLGALMQSIQTLPDAEPESIQLFRLSVKQRQKEMLTTSLRSLESALLTARSGTSDEAKLRKDEADLTLQWVERAKQIEPLGQVQIAQASQRNDLLLENGDVIRIPRRDGLVLVSGEVLFPNAVAYDRALDLMDYINRAGGFTQIADNARVVVARRDGAFEQVDPEKLFISTQVKAGDQILVLPKVDEKKRQFWKDITQILYQIAVSAKVVFDL
jgi:protein involved in polysaccharide export with SLBB domain